MPNAAQYRTYASRLDGIGTKLASESSRLGPLPGGIVKGGRLQTSIERALESASANVNSSGIAVGTMASECRMRAGVCAAFEANLAQYERDASQHSNAMQNHGAAVAAYDNAVRNAKPGEPVNASHPGAGPGNPPSRPNPPSYWSA